MLKYKEKKPEAQRVERGGGVLGQGQGSKPPPHQLGGLGERYKLPQQGPGQKCEIWCNLMSKFTTEMH